jgi:osmotically-inducible protein OsmY
MLGGKVASYIEKYLAEGAIEKIEAAKGIANELEIELAPSYNRDDTDVAKTALNAFKWTFLDPHKKIKVAVEKGPLTLSGDVEYNYQKERAEEAVESLCGVTCVNNNIKLIANLILKPNPAKVKEKIIKKFERNASIDASNIQAKVDGSKVNFKGGIKHFDEEKGD